MSIEMSLNRIMKKFPNKNTNYSKNLSSKQLQFVEYLLDTECEESPDDFAKRIDVPKSSLLEWKSNPAIVQSVYQLCVTRNGTEIPKVLKMLREKALEDRDISACKLFFQQIERISEIPETGLSVDKVLQIVNKIIEDSENSNTQMSDRD